MHPIPVHVYHARLKHWRTMPDRKIVKTRREGRPVTEYWAVGVCRLRMVHYGPDVVLYADKGVPGYPPKVSHGKIAFHYFGEAGP